MATTVAEVIAHDPITVNAAALADISAAEPL
jgi:hypothetical protein